MSRPAGMTSRQASLADQWVSQAAGGMVTALAGLAGAISYSHMRQLAQDHGQAGWHAHAFPLSVDGLEIVASLVLLAGHRSGRRPGWLAWAALVLGTVGSMAANVATAGPGMISRIIAGWPALAFIIAVKLLTGMLNHPASTTTPQPPAGQDHQDQPHRQSRGLAILPGHPVEGVPTTPGRAIPDRQAVNKRAGRSPANEPRRAAGPEPGIVGLLPAARAVRDDLYRAGQPLTRDSLAARLRQAGHPVRNSRLTPVLQNPAQRISPRHRRCPWSASWSRAITANADTLIRLARAAAGGDFVPPHAPWHRFGLSVVAIAEAENAVIRDRPARTLAIGRCLQKQAHRYSRHRLEVAAAHVALRQYPQAVDVFQDLRQARPQWLPRQRYVARILSGGHRPTQDAHPEMRDLAAYLRLPL